MRFAAREINSSEIKDNEEVAGLSGSADADQNVIATFCREEVRHRCRSAAARDLADERSWELGAGEDELGHLGTEADEVHVDRHDEKKSGG